MVSSGMGTVYLRRASPGMTMISSTNDATKALRPVISTFLVVSTKCQIPSSFLFIECGGLSAPIGRIDGISTVDRRGS